VAEEKDLAKRIGLTRGKAVLIGVLAVTFAVVLYLQLGSGGSEEFASSAIESDETPSPPPRRSAAALAAPASEAVKSAPAKEAGAEAISTSTLLNLSQWKAPDVATIIEHDPFALPPAFPQPARTVNGQILTSDGIVAADAATRATDLADAVAKLQTELDSLRSRGVSVIVREHDEYVAMIGDRTIRVGDEINGFRVTAIEPDGVRVESKVQE
jgi:hypothetical protein